MTIFIIVLGVFVVAFIIWLAAVLEAEETKLFRVWANDESSPAKEQHLKPVAELAELRAFKERWGAIVAAVARAERLDLDGAEAVVQEMNDYIRRLGAFKERWAKVAEALGKVERGNLCCLIYDGESYFDSARKDDRRVMADFLTAALDAKEGK